MNSKSCAHWGWHTCTLAQISAQLLNLQACLKKLKNEEGIGRCSTSQRNFEAWFWLICFLAPLSLSLSPLLTLFPWRSTLIIIAFDRIRYRPIQTRYTPSCPLRGLWPQPSWCQIVDSFWPCWEAKFDQFFLVSMPSKFVPGYGPLCMSYLISTFHGPPHCRIATIATCSHKSCCRFRPATGGAGWIHLTG